MPSDGRQRGSVIDPGDATVKVELLISCAVAALACATPTIAATTADAPAVAPDAGSDEALGEITVTAQRRNESIQKVPLTIQAFTGETLSQLNVVNFSDLLKFTPNVTYANNGPGAGAIFLRGLSSGFAGNQSSATIAPFPNVALYLDDQSLQFPARNADVYVADLERIEVLEGPQGTLFGGGAEAGAVRYITNKPNLQDFSGKFEGSAGGTAGGAPNGAFTATINVPIVQDKLAVRAVIYDDHQGGYIDNVPSKFTRADSDTGNYYFNNGGKTLPVTQQSNLGQYDNLALARRDFNPVDYIGGRISAKWQVSDDWDVLVSEAYQRLDAEGTFATYPVGSDFQKLGPLQTTVFSPSYNKDDFWNSALTVTGKIGDLKLVYTGAYMTRHLDTQQDYSNYSRTGGGIYYQCTGGSTGWGTGAPFCYSPVSYWHDTARNTHLTQEVRLSTPEDKRIRVIGGAFYESFRIYDIQNFDYRSIPTCTTAIIASNAVCSGVVSTIPGSTANRPGTEPSNTAFGEDTQRGYDQYAFFGSVDFDILPNLTLTGGTRYYNYKEFERGSQFETYAGNCLDVLVCAIAGSGNVNIDANNDHVTYHGFKSRGSLTWKPNSDTIVYGTFSQGFRPGGFNRATKLILPDAAGTPQLNRPNGYAPDTLTNWEVGLKTNFLDHRVQVNLSAYYMVWENVQIGFFNPGRRVRQHQLRHQRRQLPRQGARGAARRAADGRADDQRRRDLQRQQAGHRAVLHLERRRIADLRQVHHDLLQGRRRDPAAEPVRRARLEPAVCAAFPGRPPRPLRLAGGGRARLLRLGRRVVHRRDVQPAVDLSLGRWRADPRHDAAALPPVGLRTGRRVDRHPAGCVERIAVRPEPDQYPRQHLHLVGAVHQVRGRRPAADLRPQARLQVLAPAGPRYRPTMR